MKPPPLFEHLAGTTLTRCTAVFNGRGTEYGDSWRAMEPVLMKAVARKLGAGIPEDAFRAIMLAALADVKYWRHTGGYKQDSVDDGINYMAAMDAEVSAVLGARPVVTVRESHSAEELCEPQPPSECPRCHGPATLMDSRGVCFRCAGRLA